MTSSYAQSLRQTFIKDFNLCFFISLFLLTLYPSADTVIHHLFAEGKKGFLYLCLPGLVGIMTTFVVLILNHFFQRLRYTPIYYAPDRSKLAIVAFSAGFFSIYLSYGAPTTYLIALIVICISYANVKNFASKLSLLLTPDKMATPQDLGEFANFFLNLIITFSVVNITMETIHIGLKLENAFNFGKGITSLVNAVYFSIITMTTVGYGDIIPQNILARIIVGLECLTSYLMLGIMIGIITRGITFDANAARIEVKTISEIDEK